MNRIVRNIALPIRGCEIFILSLLEMDNHNENRLLRIEADGFNSSGKL